MAWKNLSYTKKGFRIGLGIGLIILILALIYTSFSTCELISFDESQNCGSFDFTFMILTIILYFPLVILISILGTIFQNPGFTEALTWVAYILSIPYFGLLGMFIGWIIQKVKSKKQ